MIRLMILAFLIALPIGTLPMEKAGQWHAVGVQIDGLDWPMSVEIFADTASVDYPSLNCGGDWDFLKTSEDSIAAIERITYGFNECLDGGLIKVEIYDDHALFYRWFDKSGKAVAGAVLIEGELRMENYDALLDLTMQALGNYFIEGPTARIDMGDDTL